MVYELLVEKYHSQCWVWEERRGEDRPVHDVTPDLPRSPVKISGWTRLDSWTSGLSFIILKLYQ